MHFIELADMILDPPLLPAASYGNHVHVKKTFVVFEWIIFAAYSSLAVTSRITSMIAKKSCHQEKKGGEHS